MRSYTSTITWSDLSDIHKEDKFMLRQISHLYGSLKILNQDKIELFQLLKLSTQKFSQGSIRNCNLRS